MTVFTRPAERATEFVAKLMTLAGPRRAEVDTVRSRNVVWFVGLLRFFRFLCFLGFFRGSFMPRLVGSTGAFELLKFM